MSTSAPPSQSLAMRVLDRLDHLIHDAETQTKPLELDPYRSQLFELFVTAEGAGYTRTGGGADLTTDGICRLLAERWGLAEAARLTMDRQTKLPPQHVNKMRLLWSVMRMWMEWNYAWERWAEFHQTPPATDSMTSA